MAIESGEDLFMHHLKTIYFIENQLTSELGDMAESTTNEDLQEAFMEHREETHEQMRRLEHVFDELGQEPAQTETPLIEALEQEKEEARTEIAEPDLQNVFYMGAGMKAERIEISIYEHMLSLARQMEMSREIRDILSENLDEEEEALDKLKTISEGSAVKRFLRELTP